MQAGGSRFAPQSHHRKEEKKKKKKGEERFRGLRGVEMPDIE